MFLCSLHDSDIERLLAIAEAAGLSYWSSEGFRSQIANRSAYSRGLISGSGNLAGFVVARLIAGEPGISEAELLNIGVDPEFHGQSGGRVLMNGFLDFCREHRAAKAWLEVRDSNHRARGFYEHFGFQAIGRRPGFYTGPVEDAILMCLEFGKLT